MKKKVWLLIDNRKGSAGQIRGIAQQLPKDKYEIIEKEIEYTKLSGLPNLWRGCSLLGLTSVSKEILKKDLPDIVLSGSRRSAPVARWIKKQTQGRAKIIQLLNPGMFGRQDYDLIFLPEHDRGKIHGKNVKYTTGSPHSITPEKLQEAKEEWKGNFDNLPHPLTALIIGGNIKGKGFTIENAQNLALAVKEFHKQKRGSLLITDSRRTGTEAEKVIIEILKDIPQHNYLWGDKNKNPYMGYLAYADNIIVTGDSVSMCCEACGTGKPVFIFNGKNWLTRKHLQFVKTLLNQNYATMLDKENLDFTPQKTLNPAQEIAQEIQRL